MTDDSTLPSGSPLETLHRLLRREQERAEAQQRDLAHARRALLQLASPPPTGAQGPVWEPVTADLAAVLVTEVLASTRGVLRSSVVSLDTGPGLDEATIREGQRRIAEGLVQRTLYPMEVMDDPDGVRWVRSWGAVGEQQRLTLEPVSDFAVFGESAVMAVATWGDPTSDYVLIRDPMLVRAFIALFDRAYERGLPVPERDRDEAGEERLLRLLALGLKDESIARYLGCSLRTVRRRVARLMDVHGAQTRFQLGSAIARVELGQPPARFL